MLELIKQRSKLMSIRNIEITIFDPADGVGIGGTLSTEDIFSDLLEDSLFGEEFQESDEERQREIVIEELQGQVKDEIDRLMRGTWIDKLQSKGAK
tara:strand:+ start:981 stop:1268 length:288 start_codon:yes stop_codon:yes gene_type:complete